jgi:hypothetical protein
MMDCTCGLVFQNFVNAFLFANYLYIGSLLLASSAIGRMPKMDSKREIPNAKTSAFYSSNGFFVEREIVLRLLGFVDSMASTISGAA